MAVGVATATTLATATAIALLAVVAAFRLRAQPEVSPLPTARYLEHLRQASAIISDVPRLQFSEVQEAAFYRELVLRSQPAIIQGWITTGWPASSLWTDEYLTRAAGHVGIQVESIGADAHVFDPEDLRRGGEDRYRGGGSSLSLSLTLTLTLTLTARTGIVRWASASSSPPTNGRGGYNNPDPNPNPNPNPNPGPDPNPSPNPNPGPSPNPNPNPSRSHRGRRAARR